eukprot:TRINITY_DN1131_c0_g1_i1.p1 TRINITY_DN1131_c0_g1~~TRINITY_DN1131_c0_g1_i1.p1  ORF type:complete len:276 (-),score=42.68 TRINITY_DN1131_c0_g1_i1:53-817(-)
MSKGGSRYADLDLSDIPKLNESTSPKKLSYAQMAKGASSSSAVPPPIAAAGSSSAAPQKVLVSPAPFVPAAPASSTTQTKSAVTLNPQAAEFTLFQTPNSPEDFQEDADVDYDAFYPDYKDCTCCRGMVYGCSGEICQTLDGCVCIYDPAFTGPESYATHEPEFVDESTVAEYDESSSALAANVDGVASELEAKVSMEYQASEELFANRLPDDEKNKDTWIPAKSKCSCCKGFVYNCNKEGCESTTDVCACIFV